MILDRVTITGADDSIDPIDLVKLSEEFPFVEWGILFSPRHQGSYRYPSDKWLSEFWKVRKSSMKLSAHLCGRWVRDIVLDADFSWFRDYASISDFFQRVQLNFHGQYHRKSIHLEHNLKAINSKQFILQCDAVNDNDILSLANSGACVPLFDVSGGAGKVPEKWPEVWPGIYCGYAGGLGPHNVDSELHRIEGVVSLDDRIHIDFDEEVVGPDVRIWIDMEKNVRSEDDSLFDLDKVRDVLVQCKGWVA